jgi:hypothetical protein
MRSSSSRSKVLRSMGGANHSLDPREERNPGEASDEMPRLPAIAGRQLERAPPAAALRIAARMRR